MDNVTLPTSPMNSCIIKLDNSQYTFYQQARLEVHSPEGKLLKVIGKNPTRMTDDDAIFQLWSQACLLEVSFDQIEEHVQVPRKAINSIVRIIDRIDLHLKKQMGM